ncbi:MAG: YgaP family membrane protein [Gammaproteobacteria bacterium]
MKFDYKRMFKFEYNVGEKEKQYRIYGGSALVFISIFTASIFFLLTGCILIATGFFGFCPINAGFHRNTCSVAGDETPDN